MLRLRVRRAIDQPRLTIQMDVIRNPSHAKVFATQVEGYGGEVAVERRAYRRVEDGRPVLGAEDDRNEVTGCDCDMLKR
jgi:hypothetical protein